jgi:hypothetical protein
MQYRPVFDGGDKGQRMMRSSAGLICNIDRDGCVSGRRVDALSRLIIVANAIMMASLIMEAGRARDLPCAPGHHLARGHHHNACVSRAMIRKDPAAVTRPYDFPNSYVLHGPRF